MAKLPQMHIKHKICVICEGYEEQKYFEKLISLNVWNNEYEFLPINAKSASKVFACYQNAYVNNSYELVLVFCDTDKFPYKEYSKIKTKIINFHDNPDAQNIIIYANPCSMQIILSHFGNVSLKNQGKKTNSDIIEKLTGVSNYDAHEDQIKAICDKIFKRTYEPMKERISKINMGDSISGSTNFITFLNKFESDNANWISELNNKL